VAGGIGIFDVNTGRVFDDFLEPVDRLEAERDLRYGQMAVVIHRAEDWPAGRICRNCREPWPCRLHRWGMSVLSIAGWSAADVVHMVAAADAGDVPW
jgi:hypothetical protein